MLLRDNYIVKVSDDSLYFVKFCDRYVDRTIKSFLSLESLESNFHIFFETLIYYGL